MLHYYINLAFRNLRNRTGFYAINITGLAVGLAACLMITHYVKFHQSFDTYQPDSERIYRILYSRWSEGQEDKVEFASATPIIGQAFLENIPEVEMKGQAFRREGIFSHEDLVFEETRAFQAETDLLQLLGVTIVEGAKTGTLDKPGTVAISRSTARRYFGNQSAIGKTIYHDLNNLYEVVAVYEDMPANTHFKADLFLSIETWKQQNPNLFQNGYIYSGFYNYVKLAEGADPEVVNQKAAEYVERTYGEALAEGEINMSFVLQPLEDIHLHSHLMHELELNGYAASINYLEIVAWFILIIAWVNFFNLSTIQAFKKLREISIRKVNGASRGQLILQLLTESAIINLMAVLIALFLFESFSLLFFNFADLPTNTPVWHQSWVYVLILIAFIAGTFSSGIYSVVNIPASHTTEVLKGTSVPIMGKAFTRKLLVTFQFMIAIGLISATTIIFSQYRLISKTPLGFSMDNMLVVHSPLVRDSLSLAKLNSMKKELTMVAGFEGATFSTIIPGKPNMYNRGGVYLYGSKSTSGKNYRVTEADANFFDVYDIRILAGEPLRGNDEADKLKILLNARGAMWADFNSPEEAIGKKLVLENEVYTIAGVADNFHQLSPKEPIEPQIFRLPRHHKGYLTIHYGNLPPEKAREEVQMLYNSFFPAHPFEYFFLDDYYNSQNLEEKRFGVVFILFSGLVIVITILGLLGLSAYTAQQKQKEIGIRKVLGASSLSIFNLMFRNYLILWAIAATISIPLTWYLIEKWLDSFALRIEPHTVFFAIPVIVVLIIALLTVWVQSGKIIKMNPVKSLRTE